jgi:hypothetical protein
MASTAFVSEQSTSDIKFCWKIILPKDIPESNFRCTKLVSSTKDTETSSNRKPYCNAAREILQCQVQMRMDF